MNNNLGQGQEKLQDNKEPKILIESFIALSQAGLSVLRVVMVLNGASVIALLAFIGNILDKVETLPDFKGAFIAYILGVFFAGVASFTSSYGQYLFFEKELTIYKLGGPPSSKFRGIRFGQWETWLGMTSLLIITGLIAFVLGSDQALTMLNELKPKVL